MDEASQQYLQQPLNAITDSNSIYSMNCSVFGELDYNDETNSILHSLNVPDSGLSMSTLQLLNEPYPNLERQADTIISSSLSTSCSDSGNISAHSRFHPYHHYSDPQESPHFSSSEPYSTTTCQINYQRSNYTSNGTQSIMNDGSIPIYNQNEGVGCFPAACQNSISQWQPKASGQFDMNSNNNNINSSAYSCMPLTSSVYASTIDQVQENGLFQQATYSNTPVASHCFSQPQYPVRRTTRPTRARTMDIDSTSSSEVELVEESNATKRPATKTRSTKKKRKKGGANEPQKPVSAYALFFRDTQAAIKAENPSATFGEISKIVASMWDSLGEEAKQVYKQKTEKAKRDYLKQLAAYRANLVSKGGLDGDEEDSQPLVLLKMKMADHQSTSPKNAASNLPSSLPLQIAPAQNLIQHQHPLDFASISTSTISNSAPSQLYATNHEQQVVYSTDNFVDNTQISPVQQIILRPIPTTVAVNTTSSPIQLRNIASKSHSPVTFLQSKLGQVIKILPSVQQPSNCETNSVQPILQTLAQETPTSFQASASTNQAATSSFDVVNYANLSSSSDIQPVTTLASIKPSFNNGIMNGVRMCIRGGCTNIAVSDAQGNNEYCSNECVVHHCRDVFDSWSSVRNISASVN